MVLQSLQAILDTLEHSPQGLPQQGLCWVVQQWPTIVGEVVAAHTRPLTLDRDILRVATSSPVWSQTLVFERRRLLKKLNSRLPQPLRDIRFSTARWYDPQRAAPLASQDAHLSSEQHPSQLPKSPQSSGLDSSVIPSTLQGGFLQHQKQLQSLPRCSNCHSPAPLGELERWSCCALCVRQQWAVRG